MRCKLVRMGIFKRHMRAAGVPLECPGVLPACEHVIGRIDSAVEVFSGMF